jgi:hypothetical protein
VFTGYNLFAMLFLSPRSAELGQNLFFAQDDVLDVIDRDLGPAVLTDEDAVAFRDFEGNDLSFVVSRGPCRRR